MTEVRFLSAISVTSINENVDVPTGSGNSRSGWYGAVFSPGTSDVGARRNL
jgi:hypothetical protein